MNQRRISALVVAAGAVALVAAWMSQGQLPSVAQAGQGGEAASRATVLLRMPRDATIASPQPFRLDAAMARTAVRDGELRVALPDGSTYPVEIERQFTDGTGHWNVVGRVQTPLGAQAMVLTFGSDAVFGVLPKPDGTLMHVTTGPGGAVTIAPAGELVPDVPGAQERTDVRIPPRPRPPAEVQTSAKAARAAKAAAAQKVRIDAPSTVRGTPIAKTAIASAATVDTTPVQITVLALYSQELVTLRGSDAAARTEVANLFALANQAHLDSGSRVRLQAVGTQQLTLEAGLFNTDVLDRVTGGLIETDLEALRDTHAADLATIIRPYQANDFSCGVAWLQGEGMQRNSGLDPAFGYSVVAVSPCDPYVLAHELGHSMGSMHDRASSTDPDTGTMDYGAYAFSFGHRTRAARTVMAYSSGQPRIGRFSSPAILACGTACGVDDVADNVRSLNLMAPSIAKFRGAAGTASAGDVEIVEGGLYDSRSALVPVYISTVPGGTFAEFGVEVVGGTATLDVDYEMHGVQVVQVMNGSRWGVLYVDVRGDTLVEGDETIELRLVPPAGITMADTTATVTIVEDDPSPMVTGKLWFPPGVPVPTEPMLVEYYGAEGYDERLYSDYAWAYPPDFDYAIPASYGSPLRIVGTDSGPQNEYAPIPQHVYEVRGDREVPLMFRRTWWLTGQVKVATGTNYPTSTFHLLASETTNGNPRYQATFELVPPDYRFATRVAEGATLELNHVPRSTGTGVPIAYQTLIQNFEPRDQVFNPVLSGLPTLFIYGPEQVQARSKFPVIVQSSHYAGATGIGFRYRTVDGTAKAGVDYVAASGTARIEEGDYYRFIDLQLLSTPRGRGPKYFDVVIDQVSGATGATTTVRTWISDQGVRAGGPQAPRPQ